MKEAISNQTQAWKFIFNSLGLDIDDQDYVKTEDIYNPDSTIAKAFMFIYSMETFLYSNINRAEREKDGSKI